MSVDQQAQLVLARSPVEGATHRALVAPGTPLVAALGDAHERVRVELNGEYIPRAEWESRTLAEGDLVSILEVPQGGGGSKDILRIVALIAVSVVAWYAAPLILGTTAGFAVKALTAGLTLAGSLLVNALIPPQVPKAADTGDVGGPGRFNRLTSSRNPFSPYNVIPRLYGEFRFYPPLAANYYTEAVTDKQYLFCLFCLGYGPLELGGNQVGGPGQARIDLNSDLAETALTPYGIKIGETDLHRYGPWEMEIGRPDQIDIYTNDVHEDQPNLPFDFIDQGGADNSNQGQIVTVTRTTLPNIDEFSVDVFFPSGIWSRDEKGKFTGVDRVDFELTWKEVGSTALNTKKFSVKGNRDDPVYYGESVKVPPGQYEVTLSRTNTFVGFYDTHFSNAVWTALRSVRYETPWTLDGVVLAALKIQATDQISGALDNISFLAKSVLRVWDGAAFQYKVTSNPAWAYLDTMTGVQCAHPVPDSRIDLGGIKAWADWCDKEKFTYNFVHDGEETIVQRARAIATTGRASFGMRDGLFTVVRDLRGDPAVQMFTPRNSWGFSFSKVYRDIPHALKMRYVNPNTWEQDERIVYMDGYDETSATEFEVIDTQGVTDPEQVWREGRFYLAEAVLRPEMYMLSVDFENLIATRGDRVRVQHDVMRVGIGAARIKALSPGRVTLDETFEMVAGKSYVLRVRTGGNQQRLEPVTTNAGEQNEFLVTSIAGLQVGDLVAFGERDHETVECKILEVEYHPDLSATLKLIPAADDIHDSDTGTIPPWNPGIKPKPEETVPLPPTCNGYNYNGGQLALQFTVPSQSVRVDRVYFRYYPEPGNPAILKTVEADPTAGTVFLPGIDVGETINVYTRSRSVHRVFSAWSDPPCSISPTAPNISNLTGKGTQIGHHLSWALPNGNWRMVQLLNGDANDCTQAAVVWQGMTDSVELPYDHPTIKFYWARLVAQDGSLTDLVPDCSSGVRVETRDPLTLDPDWIKDIIGQTAPPIFVDGVELHTWLRDLRGRIIEELALAAGFPSVDERDEVFTVVGKDIQETKTDLVAEVQERKLLGAVVGNNAAAIKEESRVRADADSAIAYKHTQLVAVVDNNIAAINTTNTALVTAEKALAQQINSLGVQVDQNTAGVQTVNTALINAEQVLAQQINTTQTDVGNLRTVVNQQQSSIDGIRGEYTVTIDNNGHVSGFGIISKRGTGGYVDSLAYFRVDKFAIVDPKVSGRLTFYADTAHNRVMMDGAHIKDLTVDRIKVKAHALSGAYFTQISDNQQYSSNWSQIGRTARQYIGAAAGTGTGSILYAGQVSGRASSFAVRMKINFYNSAGGFFSTWTSPQQTVYAAIDGSKSGSDRYKLLSPVVLMYGGNIHASAYYVEVIIEAKAASAYGQPGKLSGQGVNIMVNYR